MPLTMLIRLFQTTKRLGYNNSRHRVKCYRGGIGNPFRQGESTGTGPDFCLVMIVTYRGSLYINRDLSNSLGWGLNK
jgi:hypothetical protein